MAKKPAKSSVDLEPSTAFQLGFFTRHFDLAVIRELLRTLQKTASQNIFDELKQAVNGIRRSSSARSSDRHASLVAAADSILSPADPCRRLYDLGAALGEYFLQRLKSTKPPDAQSVWDCVQRLPLSFTEHAGCLQELAEEANGKRDLEAVIKRVVEPEEVDVLEDDEDQEGRANYERIFSELPPQVQEYLNAETLQFVISFVLKASKELEPGALDTEPAGGNNSGGELRFRLTVDVEKQIAFYDGDPFKLDTQEIACYLAALVAAHGDWLGPNELAEAYPLLKGARPDRLKPKVPWPIQGLIEMEAGKGSRIPLKNLLPKQ